MGFVVMKSWGRLGAVVAAFVLMAGFATPVSATHDGKQNMWLLCNINGVNPDGGTRTIFATNVSGSGNGSCAQALKLGSHSGVAKLKECGHLAESECPLSSSSLPEAANDDIEPLDENGEEPVTEPVQKTPPPPPPCWSGDAGNNCPVGGALRFAAPKYAMVGMPVTMYAYASWRPDANSPAQPTNGTAVIRVDGEDYSGVEFKDGVAEWRFIPETEGMKEFTASGVLFSGLSGASAYIDTVEARTYVLEYDPAAYVKALKKKAVEVGETYVITDPNQAQSYLEDRYEWSVSEKSDDVCAVYETKKGAVKAKFTDSGKCTVIWLDKESVDSGKYTFIAKK